MVLSAKRGRWATISLKTQETDLDLVLSLDGIGEYDISTGVPSLDKLLRALVIAGRFDLDLKVQEDGKPECTKVAGDIGMAVGQALEQALIESPATGLCGDGVAPVQDGLFRAVVEMTSSPEFYCAEGPAPDSSDTDCLALEFFKKFSERGHFTLSLDVVKGTSAAGFEEGFGKACGVALKRAIRNA